MSKLVFWWALAASHGAVLPARARAAVRPLVEALEVRPGAACVDRVTLAAQLAARLGEQKLNRELSIIVIASPSDAREVAFELWRGTRRLTSRSFFPAPEGCAALEAILTLSIAMALKVSLVEAPEPARERPAIELGTQSSLAALAEVGLGLLPSVSGGLLARAQHELGSRFLLRVDALGHTSRDRALSGDAGRFEFDAWLAAGRLAACWLVPVARALLLHACAGVGAGALCVAGHGYRGARAAWLPWFDVGVSAELSVRLSRRWSFGGGGNLSLALGERRFGVRDEDGAVVAARTLPSIAATLRAGPALHF